MKYARILNLIYKSKVPLKKKCIIVKNDSKSNKEEELTAKVSNMDNHIL